MKYVAPPSASSRRQRRSHGSEAAGVGMGAGMGAVAAAAAPPAAGEQGALPPRADACRLSLRRPPGWLAVEVEVEVGAAPSALPALLAVVRGDSAPLQPSPLPPSPIPPPECTSAVLGALRWLLRSWLGWLRWQFVRPGRQVRERRLRRVACSRRSARRSAAPPTWAMEEPSEEPSEEPLEG